MEGANGAREREARVRGSRARWRIASTFACDWVARWCECENESGMADAIGANAKCECASPAWYYCANVEWRHGSDQMAERDGMHWNGMEGDCGGNWDWWIALARRMTDAVAGRVEAVPAGKRLNAGSDGSARRLWTTKDGGLMEDMWERVVERGYEEVTGVTASDGRSPGRSGGAAGSDDGLRGYEERSRRTNKGACAREEGDCKGSRRAGASNEGR